MGSYAYESLVMVSCCERRGAALTILKHHGKLALAEWCEKVALLADQYSATAGTMWITATLLVSDHTVTCDINREASLA